MFNRPRILATVTLFLFLVFVFVMALLTFLSACAPIEDNQTKPRSVEGAK